MRTRKLGACLLVTTGVVVSSASAQVHGPVANCGERKDLVQRLERMFGEVQKGAGLVSAAQLLEVWGSDETGTWTILMTRPDGQSCVLAAGEAWRDVELAVEGEPL
jgi:hypothetical protein